MTTLSVESIYAPVRVNPGGRGQAMTGIHIVDSDKQFFPTLF